MKSVFQRTEPLGHTDECLKLKLSWPLKRKPSDLQLQTVCNCLMLHQILTANIAQKVFLEKKIFQNKNFNQIHGDFLESSHLTTVKPHLPIRGKDILYTLHLRWHQDSHVEIAIINTLSSCFKTRQVVKKNTQRSHLKCCGCHVPTSERYRINFLLFRLQGTPKCYIPLYNILYAPCCEREFNHSTV